MKLAAVVMAASNLVLVSPAGATPVWRVDLSARGVGSVELDDGAAQRRDGIVPAIAIRALRDVGPVQLGATIGAGFPAWYGKTEAALSIDHEHALATHWSIALGLDAGLGLFYFDAPPMTSSSSDALLYWGPLARARVQLHVVTVLPNQRAVGLVVGTSAAITSARYMSTASGTGLRFEPELEVGLTMRL